MAPFSRRVSRRSRTYWSVIASTRLTNRPWLANGSPAQTSSSSVHPFARSGLVTPDRTPRNGGANDTSASADQPFGQASSTTLMTSLAVASPVTLAVLVTCAAALLATRTVIVIGGYADPAANGSLRVQLEFVQLQPSPDAATGPASRPGLLTSGEIPAGSVSVTVTAPSLA